MALDIQLTCRHCQLADDVRDYATKKVEKLSKHFDGGVHGAELILTAEAGETKAELIIGTVRSQRLVATANAPTPQAAVDLAVDKMDHQVTKTKGKLRDHHA
jgi:ribosomal subunit interface protein